MYIKRFHQSPGGRSVTYVALAHNVRERRADGHEQTRPHLVLSLGPEHRHPPGNLEDLVAIAELLYARRIKEGLGPQEAIAKVRETIKERVSGLLSPDDGVQESRRIGMRLLLTAVWSELGLQETFRKAGRKHRIRAFDFERLVFGLILNRLVDPKSKLAANEWLRQDAYMPEAEGWQVQHYYRALDVLHEHHLTIEEDMGEALISVSAPEDRQVALVDTTSMFFESRQTDAEVAELSAAWEAWDQDPNQIPPLRPRPAVVNEPPLRLHGHNKDGHPGDPQVVVASACLRNGLVVRHRVYPGNTNDVTIAKDLIKHLKGIPDETAKVWVSDGGMTSPELMVDLWAGNWHWLAAESLRKSKVARAHVLPVVGRYAAHPTKAQYTFKTVALPSEESPLGRPETMVVVRNALERERQLSRQVRHLDEIKETLGKQGKAKGGHSKAVCALIDHPKLKRYLKPSEKRSGHYVLDQEAVRREAQLAGTRMLRTTLTDMEGFEIFEGYQLLQLVERNHREYKGPLRLRPCYHRMAERIKAHVMLTVLAGNCVRRLEAMTGLSMDELRRRFDRVLVHQVREGGRARWQVAPLSKKDREVLRQVGYRDLPLQWVTWREPALTPLTASIQRSPDLDAG